ncbi:hypothetical protein [Verminephrobacter eiseniae]|uniref:hypothetical protein n=1 Tax=Verminephrobacter eiseniae TaxID=364317 RepID=UPI002AA2A0FC|nr:hypothetical protein [Verminephrobacter eiseniae]
MGAARAGQIAKRMTGDVDHGGRVQGVGAPGHVQGVVGAQLQVQWQMHLAGNAVVFGAKAVAVRERLGDGIR